MPEQAPDLAGVLARVDAGFDRLEPLVRDLDAGAAARQGGDGWRVKDHVAHVAAWERSLIALLSGEPRHEALGVDRATYLAGDIDATNAAVYRANAGRDWADVLSDFRATHARLVALLQALGDGDLVRTYSSFQPDEPGEESGAPIVGWIAGNAWEHFEEHAEAIAALLAADSTGDSRT